jgi:hypothetical protein
LHKNRTIRAIGLVALILIFLVGVLQLFMLGFEDGEFYPAYSSLRSDPLGTRALYESLKNFEDVRIQRNHQILQALKFKQTTTFFYLGASETNWDLIPEELIQMIDQLMQSGGRLVLSFLPVHKESINAQNEKSSDLKGDDTTNSEASPDDTSGKSDQMTEPKKNANDKKAVKRRKAKRSKIKADGQDKHYISIKKHWGIEFEFNDDVLDEDTKYLELSATSSRPQLPSVISWHTNLFFQLHDPGWQVIYSSEGQPAIIERSFGQGTIVLCADSFFISNEALWSERYPKLLLWLIGGNTHLVFDEAHFGIYERPAVASLIRHYRFHWFFAALILLALLFVWKSAVYFVPPRHNGASVTNDVISEKDVAQGLVALLRRNIPVKAIMTACVQEWEKTFKNDRRIAPGTFERVKNVITRQDTSSKKYRDPVAGYRKIYRIISKEKGYE